MPWRAHLDPARAAAARWLRWWLASLAEMVPPRLRARLWPPRRQPVLILGTDGPRLVEELRDGAAAGGVVIRLGATAGLVKRISLPIAAAENLREVVGFELDRHTPFPAETLAYGCAIERRDVAAERIVVVLAAAPRAAVEAALATAREMALDVAAVELADAPAGIDLLATTTTARAGAARRLPALLWSGAAVLATVALLLPLAQRHEQAAALRAESAALAGDAETARRLRDEVTRLDLEQRFLLDLRRQRPRAIEVLAEVTRRLPDGAWALDFQYRAREIELTGYAEAASALVALLEASPLLEGVNFRSPVTPDGRAGVERFHLVARLERRP